MAGDTREDEAFVRALTTELARKSDLLWVSVGGSSFQAMWHGWHDGAIALVTGGLEQRDPGLSDGDDVDVLLRSKEDGSRQLRVTARVREVPPDSADWDSCVSVLHAKRLNPPDGEQQPERWRRESNVWLLVPSAQAKERPGSMTSDAHREEPRPTAVTTKGKNPLHLGRATKRRRSLG